jgi:hypothetical protein
MVASQQVRARRSLNSLAASEAFTRQGAGMVTRPAKGRRFSGLVERDRFAEVAVGKALSRGRCRRVDSMAAA